MVANTSKLIIALALIAAVQGSAVKDLAVEYSQMLAEHLSSGVEEVTRLKESAVDQVTNDHLNHLTNLQAHADSKVEQSAAKCQPAAKQQIHKQVSESVTDRFLHCINFTSQIADLEKMVLNVTDQISTVEDGVCLAITNLTACNGGGVIEEIHCISSGLLGYINDFSKHSSNIKNIIVAFNKQLREIGHQFLQCFTSVDNNIEYMVQILVDTKC